MYMTVKEASERWGISDRRVRILCSEGKIPGAYQEGRGWKIPVDAQKPSDGRFKYAHYPYTWLPSGNMLTHEDTQ